MARKEKTLVKCKQQGFLASLEAHPEKNSKVKKIEDFFCSARSPKKTWARLALHTGFQ